jgi:methylated-DNA-[protein]-cysteine S-methyltransferase
MNNQKDRIPDDVKALSRLAALAPPEAELDRHAEAAARAFADDAWDAGAADVAYASTDSPFGPLLVAVTARGVVLVAYPNVDPDASIDRLARAVSPRVLRSSRATEDLRRELDEYFDHRRQRFDVPVDLRLTNGFTRRILRAASRIPFGEVRTYRDVATSAGNPAAVRAAGNALGANPIPIVVPCHRVVRTGGSLGGYTGGLERKAALLQLEGVLEA